MTIYSQLRLPRLARAAVLAQLRRFLLLRSRISLRVRSYALATLEVADDPEVLAAPACTVLSVLPPRLYLSFPVASLLVRLGLRCV